MNAIQVGGAARLRTVFISDLHLGAPHCHAAELAAFLAKLDCQRLYLVGDVFDLHWLLKRRLAWTPAQTRVLDAVQSLVRRGVEVIYIPGNHDGPLRRYRGLMLPGVSMRRRVVHVTADGRRLLVTHGDEFDVIVRRGGAGEWIGEWLYEGLLFGNRHWNRLRQRLGYRYFSLADFLKRRSDDAERYIARFRAAVVADARRRGLDGVVCGHIHRPELREVDGVLYANDGDWVESLSALIEAPDGTLSLWRFGAGAEEVQRLEPVRWIDAAA
jgi:UDP-2,3-diacylglucosamine pyrophosphatase LpxH